MPKRITAVRMSYYVFHTPDLLDTLTHLKTDHSQGEYYPIGLKATREEGSRPSGSQVD